VPKNEKNWSAFCCNAQRYRGIDVVKVTYGVSKIKNAHNKYIKLYKSQSQMLAASFS